MNEGNTMRDTHPLPSRRTALRRAAGFALGAALLAASLAAPAATTFAVPPLPPGPYPVACSNVAQDFGRLLPGEDVQAYWEGLARGDGTPRYATDLLADAANTLGVTVVAPNDGSLYGSFAGRAVRSVVLVCHPTAAADPRPDYALPTGKTVPHMQRGAEGPLWPDATTRFPVLLFSHGYGGSPISNDYVAALLVFASYGYVVAAPFHGDFRISDLSVDDAGDGLQVLLRLDDFLALQALRPLALSATVDLLLAHPHWRDRIDADRIGGFGASMGGESMLLMAGAGMTKSFGLSWAQVTDDPRLKAAVGYVPYFGQFFLPAFGRDQRGLDGIALPYLAIAGTADTTAPIVQTIEGVERLAGPRGLVALEGVEHAFDVASTNDIFTWSVTFLDAHVRGDPLARARLSRMANVAGGGDDGAVIPYNVPPPPNFGGLWWNAPAESESGWGLSFAHQGDTLFAAWFTYDLDGSPLWLVVAADRVASGNAYAGTLYRATGPAFDAQPFDPARVSGTPVGTARFAFTDDDNATFDYIVGDVARSKSITREAFALPVPTCTWGAAARPVAGDRAARTCGGRRRPASSPAGASTSRTRATSSSAPGSPTASTAGRRGSSWPPAGPRRTPTPATLFTATGPPFDSLVFDPARVVPRAVGTATLTFADGNRAAFAYTVNGVAQTKQITRQIFAPPGTVCQ